MSQRTPRSTPRVPPPKQLQSASFKKHPLYTQKTHKSSIQFSIRGEGKVIGSAGILSHLHAMKYVQQKRGAFTAGFTPFEEFDDDLLHYPIPERDVAKYSKDPRRNHTPFSGRCVWKALPKFEDMSEAVRESISSGEEIKLPPADKLLTLNDLRWYSDSYWNDYVDDHVHKFKPDESMYVKFDVRKEAEVLLRSRNNLYSLYRCGTEDDDPSLREGISHLARYLDGPCSKQWIIRLIWLFYNITDDDECMFFLKKGYVPRDIMNKIPAYSKQTPEDDSNSERMLRARNWVQLYIRHTFHSDGIHYVILQKNPEVHNMAIKDWNLKFVVSNSEQDLQSNRVAQAQTDASKRHIPGLPNPNLPALTTGSYASAAGTTKGSLLRQVRGLKVDEKLAIDLNFNIEKFVYPAQKLREDPLLFDPTETVERAKNIDRPQDNEDRKIAKSLIVSSDIMSSDQYNATFEFIFGMIKIQRRIAEFEYMLPDLKGTSQGKILEEKIERFKKTRYLPDYWNLSKLTKDSDKETKIWFDGIKSIARSTNRDSKHPVPLSHIGVVAECLKEYPAHRLCGACGDSNPQAPHNCPFAPGYNPAAPPSKKLRSSDSDSEDEDANLAEAIRLEKSELAKSKELAHIAKTQARTAQADELSGALASTSVSETEEKGEKEKPTPPVAMDVEEATASGTSGASEVEIVHEVRRPMSVSTMIPYCTYPLCKDNEFHSIRMCPQLNGRCKICHYRGHVSKSDPGDWSSTATKGHRPSESCTMDTTKLYSIYQQNYTKGFYSQYADKHMCASFFAARTMPEIILMNSIGYKKYAKKLAPTMKELSDKLCDLFDEYLDIKDDFHDESLAYLQRAQSLDFVNKGRVGNYEVSFGTFFNKDEFNNVLTRIHSEHVANYHTLDDTLRRRREERAERERRIERKKEEKAAKKRAAEEMNIQ